MYALVAYGEVNGVSRSKRKTSIGKWLPLIEDPKSFSPIEAQHPVGFTVQKTRVIRHWKTNPRVLNEHDFNTIQEQTEALAQAIQTVAPQELKQEVTSKLQSARLVEGPQVKGEKL